MPINTGKRAWKWLLRMIEQNNYVALAIVALASWFIGQWAWGLMTDIWTAFGLAIGEQSLQIQMHEKEIMQLRELMQQRMYQQPFGVELELDMG